MKIHFKRLFRIKRHWVPIANDILVDLIDASEKLNRMLNRLEKLLELSNLKYGVDKIVEKPSELPHKIEEAKKSIEEESAKLSVIANNANIALEEMKRVISK